MVSVESEGSRRCCVALALLVVACGGSSIDEREGDGGGTGQVADWSSAARLASRRPVMLAGGLTEANVAQAVLQVRPWAVDVSSGVEWQPGLKSPDRMRAFFERVREADAEGQ